VKDDKSHAAIRRRRGDRLDEDWGNWLSPFSNLSPFDRSGFFPSISRDFERMWRGLDRFPSISGRDLQPLSIDADWAPRADIVETKNSFEVNAELPGVPKENIKVNVVDDTLTIEGEKKADVEKKDEEGKVYQRERSYGSFKRSFVLPENADIKNIHAGYDHGVLKLILSKKTPSHDKIEVKID